MSEQPERPARAAAHDETRRAVLRGAAATALGLLATVSGADGAASATRSLQYPELRGLDDGAADDAQERTSFRKVNGVQVQDILAGSGDAFVRPGATVSVKYVLRRSNGYFLDASYGFDRFDTFTFVAGSGAVIDGFDRALDGMREGGRRRFVVPPQLGYGEKPDPKGPGPIPPGFGPRRALTAHAKEPLVFEVLVVRVR